MAKQKQFDYDLIIIGSGAGGSVAAHIANRAGLNVALIEAERIGGECPNIGCVPTKAILQAASVYEAAKNGARFGIRSTTIGYNYPSIKAWKDLAVKRTGTYLGEEMYTSEGISVINGSAHFIDKHTISVGVARFTAKKFLIATGSTISVPPIPGLKTAGYITYKEAINLKKPPKSLAIIGGGAIGCEFATALAIFGTKIYIIDSDSHLLKEDEAAIEFVRFPNIEKEGTIEYSYAAMVLTKNDSIPKFVRLCQEAELQQLFDSAGRTSTTRVKNFYRGLDLGNSVNLSLGSRLYNLIWLPLEPFLKRIKNIAYSPAEKLYSVAFHALPADSNTLLIDKYNLQQYTSI